MSGEGDAWAFGGVSIQSLQAELAAAEQEKQTLLQQAQVVLQSCEGQKDLEDLSEGTYVADSAKDQILPADSALPKAPLPLNHDKPKQPPLRSLSWGGGPKSSSKSNQQPQRRSTFTLADSAPSHRRGMPQEQPVQQEIIQQWLCQEQSAAAASGNADMDSVRQGVLQEVLQAVTLTTKATTQVDFDHLTVQAVAEVAKQQLADASEAAVREKEAAVSKSIQSVQRRASKEALQQADQVVAKAQQAAADAAQRSDEEAARLRRDSEAWKKEKRGLVQRCTSAERDLAAAVANQERTQQQLTQVKAASKASDISRAQANLQHHTQLADLHQQLEAARQCTADLQEQHQHELGQQLASAAATAADTHKRKMEALRREHTAACHQQVAAMDMLQREVALLTQDMEHAMSGMAEEMSALHEAASSSQSELQSQLQQLRTQIAALQSDSSSVGSVQEALLALMDIRQQLDAAGCGGIGPLLQEHQQLQAQAVGNKQACVELQQQLQEQTEAHDREVSDLTHMTTKVQDLEFDLGSIRESLQVKGEECQVLQRQRDEVQHEMDCLQAEHAKDASAAISHQHTVKEQADRHSAAMQQLHLQLQAAVQHFMQLQQQAAVQAAQAYKAACTSSAKCIQELQDRYFHSTPVQPFVSGKHSSNSRLLKHRRDSIVAAYGDFQQRRAGFAFDSPSSTMQRKTWQRGSLGVSQSQQATFAEGPGRDLNGSSRFMDSTRSFAAPVSRSSSGQPFHAERDMMDGTMPRTSSSATHRRGLSHQPSQAAPGPDPSGPQGLGSGQQLQHDVSLYMQPAGLKSAGVWPDMIPAVDLTAWVLPEVQPDPSWLSPFLQQTLLFEGCLLNALTALLTQTGSDGQEEQNAPGKRPMQQAAVRQQCWPKAAPDSQQLCDDTTGEMVRAMSSQKRDLSRRLKAAESKNRQLRSELQELRAGGHSGPAIRPMPTQLSSTTTAPCAGVRGSWQEMAAVLDMLQDISIPSEDSQPGKPFSAMSPTMSPQRKPRCSSAVGSPLRAVSRKPRCASALSPISALHQPGAVPKQHLSHHGVMSPLATSRSKPLSNSKMPLAASGNRSRQEWHN